MPRLMSFALTTRQMLAETKTVTRRKGWANLKPGELFWAVEKAMGLKPGEKVKRLKLCRCLSNRPEPLDAITRADVVCEGFACIWAGRRGRRSIGSSLSLCRTRNGARCESE